MSVGTGSEPRRMRDAILDRGLPRVAVGETEADALVRYADEVADTFEVESGHDEQTEAFTYSDEDVKRGAEALAVFSNAYRDPEGPQFEGTEEDYLMEQSRKVLSAVGWARARTVKGDSHGSG